MGTIRTMAQIALVVVIALMLYAQCLETVWNEQEGRDNG